MDDQVKSLRQQVAAAEFLLHSLQAQLKEAEAKAVGQSSEASGSARRLSVANTTPVTGAGGNEGTNGNIHPDLADDGLDAGGGADDGENGTEGDDDAPGETINDSAQVFQLPSLEVGITYPSLEDVKRAAIAHAISQGWTCGVDKRDRTRLLLKCRSDPSCPFHLRAEQYEDGARIASYKPDHSCNFQPDQSHVSRSHATQLKFLREQLPTFMDVTENTTAQEISDAIFERFGTRVSLKQCRSLRTAPKRKRKPSIGTCSTCGAIGHNKKTCGRVTEG
jgi:hypothetical protein